MVRQFNHSRKRDAILTVLQGTKCHPTADWIYREIKATEPDISLGTVYRNLAILKEEGKILSVGVVDGQERFDGYTLPHSHFICRSCGAVLDLEGIEIPETLWQRAGEMAGSLPETGALSFTGLCSVCRAKA